MARKDPREPFTRISPEEAREMLERGDVQLVDVRDPGEYRDGHIPNAQLIPVNSVFGRINEVAEDRDVIFVCAVGQRSALACEMAAAAGRTRLFNIDGGTKAWIEKGYPVEQGLPAQA
jgi:rhodanese-related sulfurtransferase